MDRLPKPPPFPIGTQLRYRGNHGQSGYGCNPCKLATGKSVYVPCRPATVTVAEHRPGHQGTLRQLTDDEGNPEHYEDTGEPIRDTTRDGYCLYRITCPECGSTQWGPVIDHDDLDDWEVVK